MGAKKLKKNKSGYSILGHLVPFYMNLQKLSLNFIEVDIYLNILKIILFNYKRKSPQLFFLINVFNYVFFYILHFYYLVRLGYKKSGTNLFDFASCDKFFTFLRRIETFDWKHQKNWLLHSRHVLLKKGSIILQISLHCVTSIWHDLLLCDIEPNLFI